MSKYNNVKTITSDGEAFDSIKEANRWCELLFLQRAGEITELRRQIPYELVPDQYECYPRRSKTGRPLKDGKKLVERKIVYVADFVYTDKKGETIVEDVKGCKQGAGYEVFVIKRKLMRAVHGIKVIEI